MAARRLRVVFTRSAWGDLEKIVAYWSRRGEPWRGEQYAHDLPAEAIRPLSDPGVVRRGHHLRRTAYPEVQELPAFKRSYRILYLRKEAEGIVEVLRCWHSHRGEPFKELLGSGPTLSFLKWFPCSKLQCGAKWPSGTFTNLKRCRRRPV